MENRHLVRDFVWGGATRGEGSNLKIVNDKLISYKTVIARRGVGTRIFLNKTKYSRSTSCHQNYVRDFTASPFLVELEEDQFNTNSALRR